MEEPPAHPMCVTLQYWTCTAGRDVHTIMGRAHMAVRELLQWEHTAEYKPGIVSKRDKFRPNLLQNNSPIKCTQSVLIHP